MYICAYNFTYTNYIDTAFQSPQVGSAYLVMKPGVPWTKPAAVAAAK